MESTDEKWTESQKTAMNLRNKLLLVSAAAGSGKTSVLTERIIRRLLDPNDPICLSELLIVTFTRSAAAELKSRIAKALSAALAENPGDKHLSDQLLLLGSAQISTIDSFFQQAVRSNFERLGLPSAFRIADQNEIYALAQEMMDNLISEFYRKYEPPVSEADPASAFRKLHGNPFADCMDHIFNGTSRSDLGKILLEFHERFSAYPEGAAVLSKSAEQLCADASVDFLSTTYGKTFRDRVCGLVSSFLDRLKEVARYHEADPQGTLKQSAVLASDMDACEAVLRASAGTWDGFLNALVCFNFAKFQQADGKPGWSLSYQTARNSFKIALKKYRDLATEVSPVELAEDFRKTADLARMLDEFYRAFDERFLQEKINRGILDFNDVRNALYRLLTGPDGKAISADLCGKYREIYIDEYQDVDETQDRIFAILGGDHRFMVGDIKQSIYGFRGSEPAVFADYRRSMPLSTDPAAEASPKVCVFMSENFRCNRTVIDFANTVCSFLFSASPESIGYLPADDLQHGKKDPEQKIPVCVRMFEKPEETEAADAQAPDREAEWIAAEISRLLRGDERLDNGNPIRPSDIAILSRNGNRYLDPYLDALKRLDIPVSAPDAGDLTRSPILIDLVNLLRSIDNPYRDLPLSEYLTSETGGFTLEELSLIRQASPAEKSLYDALSTVADNPEASLCGKSRDFVEWLENYRRLAASQPADRFLRILYLDPLFTDRSASPEFLALYEQARVYQRSSWCGLYGFLDYVTRLWEGKKIRSGGFGGSENGVQVMTMHASKGLEFPVVFVVGCGRAFSTRDVKPPLLYHRQVGFASSIYHSEQGASSKNLIRRAVEYAMEDENAEGEIRLLYVALTRARERLYVTGTPAFATAKGIREAETIRRANRYSILSAKSFLAWILAALGEKGPVGAQKFVDYLPVAPDKPIESVLQTSAPLAGKIAPRAENDLSSRFRALIDSAEQFTYPLDALRGIPTKAAASKLRPDLLDVLKDDDGNTVSDQVSKFMEKSEPSFDGLLAEHRKPTAAEIGTATHAFLQFCDLPHLSPDGVEAEIDRLVAQKFLSKETAAIVNRNVLRKFAASPLIARVQSAKRIYREQKFSLFFPLSELTADPSLASKLEGQELFVQGSIDLILLDPDGMISLFDYKTDHITPEERSDRALLLSHLKARHGNQLACYSRAVENLFGKRPDKIYLFMLALGEAVEI